MDPTKELHKAFSNGDTNKILSLLNKNHFVDVNSRDVIHGLQTFLMHSCHIHVDSATREDIFHLLIERGADVNLVDSSGRSALAHACIAERADMVGLLSQLGACDPNIADSDGNTAVIYAVRSRNAKVVAATLDGFRNLDVNHSNNKGRCALMEAEAQHDSVLCKLLVAHGADVRVLSMVSMNKDRNPFKNERCPTPEALNLSPRTTRRNKNSKSHKLGALIIENRLNRSAMFDRSPELSRSLNGSNFIDRNSRFSRSPSYSSDKDSCAEDIPEEDEESEDVAPDFRSTRRNSLSLPDLRAAGQSTLLKKYNESFPVSPNSSAGNSPRCGTPTSSVKPLPRLAEEEYDDMPPGSGRLDRRGSMSLPNLSDCSRALVSAQGHRLSEENSGSEEEEDEYDGIILHEPDLGEMLPPINATSSLISSPRGNKGNRDPRTRYRTVKSDSSSASKRGKLITAVL